MAYEDTPLGIADRLVTVKHERSLASDAANTIRDLYALAKCLDDLCCAYRMKSRPSERLLDEIERLRHLLA